MWDWPPKQFVIRDLTDEPALSVFAKGLVAADDELLDVEQNVISRYGLRVLPLVEWNHSCDAQRLFEELRRAGSTRGFFVDYPGQEELGHRFRECDLSDEVASVVWERDLFGWATIFTDDKFQSVVASYFTDLTHLCMSPTLFVRIWPQTR